MTKGAASNLSRRYSHLKRPALQFDHARGVSCFLGIRFSRPGELRGPPSYSNSRSSFFSNLRLASISTIFSRLARSSAIRCVTIFSARRALTMLRRAVSGFSVLRAMCKNVIPIFRSVSRNWAFTFSINSRTCPDSAISAFVDRSAASLTGWDALSNLVGILSRVSRGS